jgi:CRISPR-associated endonuclease/helicase Cas3
MKRVLWAKSKPANATRNPPTVAEHCRGVRTAAAAIWSCVEIDLANAMRIDAAELRGIEPLYLIAALLHDVGKVNSAFQMMVQNFQRTWKRQPLRHEILSALIASHPRFWREWLMSALGERDFWVVVWAVAGHHLEIRERLPDESNDPIYRTGDTPSQVTIFLDDDQVDQLLTEIDDVLRTSGRSAVLPVGKAESFGTLEDEVEGLESLARDFIRDARQSWKRLDGDARFRRDIAVLKALLIAADIAGSALPAEAEEIGPWIGQALRTRLNANDLQEVISASLGGKNARQFQKDVGNSPASATVVTAGCGNGKTTAAYMWARRHAVGRKLFFTYPTTGTASAGFKDYLSVQRHLERALIHGRAWVDLQSIPGSPEDTPVEMAQRLESLQAWGQHVIACTVDTVVGLVQNQRRSLFSFPAILAGAIVFDEVHSYDRKLFGSLLRFLAMLPGIPVLLMSATIPPARLAALKRALGSRMSVNNSGAPEPICGDHRLETINRYRIEWRDSTEECWRHVSDALGSDKKILWVCNTVADAVDIYREGHRRFGANQKIVYHSRFCYRHRVQRQDKVVAEFAYREDAGHQHERMLQRGALVVSTQVCEMSLDLSADLLVTALCPLPALVQRLGRLNRYASGDDPWPCLIFPFEIGRKPYERDEQIEQMRDCERVIRDLHGKPCSQQMLADRINNAEDQEDWSEDLYSAWLDGGWQSESLPLRDSDNSVTIIREEDRPEIERELGPENRHNWSPKTLVPWTIPMLFPKKGFMFSRRIGGYPLAQTGSVTYSDLEGAEWATQKKA